MKNTYFIGYFPLFSIILFSFSFSIYTVLLVIDQLEVLGIYNGMLEFFTASGIRLALFILFALLFFMIFSALKLISNTMIELSLLFFSKDREGHNLTQIRGGSAIYLIASALSLFLSQYITVMICLFIVATFGYFLFFVFKISPDLTTVGLIGIVFFHVLFWFSFILTIFFILLRLYNSFIASLPL